MRQFGVQIAVAAVMVTSGFCGDTNDPLLNQFIDLFLKKGLVTQEEVDKIKAEAEAMQSNQPPAGAQWKINNGIKNVELYGDFRLRYEDRDAKAPGGKIELERGRYAVRLGLRGEAFEDFYYGLRLDTAANPRSPWVTFGSSTSGSPFQGPFGKSTAGINIGQVYIGWHPESWVDLTVGKMPQPLYTTPMVWDTDLNPEGAAEHFKYTVGDADFFANFGQFLYQDLNPNSASGGFGVNGLVGQSSDNIFQFAWQGGFAYHFDTNTFAKVAGTLYHYVGLQKEGSVNSISPYFNGPFIGEGTFLGPGSGTVDGSSGFGTSSGIPTLPSLGFPLNQVGLNHLLVIEVPFEFDFKICQLNARFFGDVAYNLEGKERAQDAANGYAQYITAQKSINPATSITPFSAQTKDVKAYQVGFGIGNGGTAYTPMGGLVYGSGSKKNAWEIRTYWQHVEQYALDPNLLDSDFFEGRGNLEGLYVAAAYGFSANVIATARYGYAMRINKLLGTGGSNQDIPQVNPINHYDVLQLDLTFRF